MIENCCMLRRTTRIICGLALLLVFSGCGKPSMPLGQNEALRVYVEFADGTNRGMYDPETGTGGFPDEGYDATTAMVINWHKLTEPDSNLTARLEYRSEYPVESSWQTVSGKSFDFWHREEKINRVLLKGLTPNTVYSFKVAETGKIYRFRTMPSSLEERAVKMVVTSDHQSPEWNDHAHDNAKMAALMEPDMFVVIGDFVNDAGKPVKANADRWALYLDNLYKPDEGYFIYEAKIEDRIFENMIIPHVAILGNHETGDKNHIRWPSCVATGMSEPGYPQYTPANWMELLFHFPYTSEGFYSEYRPDHPNINPETSMEGFGHGGFGKLSFSDYLMLVALDNGSQNWEGAPDAGLRDWEGHLITDRWPWFENHHADVRQDLWLKNLLEPQDGREAQEKYDYIIPVWHRGLFGAARINMSLKNRGIFEYWLPVLYRNGMRFFVEAHDHLYGRSIPMGITQAQPENTYIEKEYYEPVSWKLTSNLTQEYLDQYYSVNCLKDKETGDIVGWEYKGNYITYDPQGMRSFGYGGWAAGRRQVGDRGAGNAGWWFSDPEKGGAHFSGEGSYHLNMVELTPEGLYTKAYEVSQLENFESGVEPQTIHNIFYDKKDETWSDQ